MQGDWSMNVWKLALGILLLASVYFLIGIRTVIEKIASVDLFFVLLSVALMIIILAMSGLNVQISVRPFQKISLLKSLKYYLFSWTIGFAGLGKMGELSIIPLLQKEGLSAGQATAAAILDKIITLFTLLLFSAIGLLFFFAVPYAVQSVLLGFFVLAVVVFFVWTPRGRDWLKRIIGKRSAWFFGFGKAIDSYSSKRLDVVALNTVVTIARWVLLAVFTQVLFWGFGFYPAFLDVVFVTTIASLVSLIPISPNGIGVREITYTFLAALRGWPATITVSVITLSLAIHYAIALVVLVLFAREIREMAKRAPSAIGGK